MPQDYRPSEADLTAWVNKQVWLDGCDLNIELQQARQEGRVLGELEDTITKLLAVPAPDKSWHQHIGGQRDSAWLARAGAVVDAVQDLPFAPDAPHEPDALADIQAARQPTVKVPAWKGSAARWQKHLHGGLLGRICGCMLGKPVEGWPRADIAIITKACKNWPIANYFTLPTPAQQRVIAKQKPNRNIQRHWRSVLLPYINGMVEDDDTNYTVIGFELLKKFGANFTPLNVAGYWCDNVPVFHTCTAERVAYRNFLQYILPPHSARYRNPFREWIGAQIRADYFGYANPGRPQRAAEWAWRDASISHVKNGIYGEMWVAAMLAAAYVAPKGDWAWVIRAGLDQIPARSRLAGDIKTVMQLHAAGSSFDAVVDQIHKQWDETKHHDWCHTNSNAQVVAAALLFGADDYTQTIGQAVMAGFDTDCNGATTGSLWGIMHGVDALPKHWTKPIKNILRTGITGYHEVKIDHLAKEMTKLAVKLK
jgi:hypothetical protein